MPFFNRKPKCPNCGHQLQEKPARKEMCPHCGKPIHVRQGELVTAEEAHIGDWLGRLEVTRKQFDRVRDELSKQFGQRASVNDTLWRILNNLVVSSGGDFVSLEYVYRNMAALVAGEGGDPTQYLIEAERCRAQREGPSISTEKDVFLGQEELRYVRQLRKNAEFDKAEALLLRAEPSPAVLDELRKLASSRAAIAKKQDDWPAVVRHLEQYESYAAEWREHLLGWTNQEPPSHTERDQKLLAEAKAKLTRK